MDTHDFMSQLHRPVTPLELPRIRPQVAQRNRDLSIKRSPVMLAEDIALSLVPDARLDWIGAGKPLDIAFSIAGEMGYLRTVTPVVQRLLARANLPIRPDSLDTELAAMVIEHVLSDAIEALEQKLGNAVALLNFDRPAKHNTLAHLSFELHFDGGDVVFPGTLHGSAALLSKLARGWMQRPVEAAAVEEAVFAIAARVAFTDLTVPSLKALGIGDAMLFDRIAVPGGVAVFLAEAMHARATFDDQGNLYFTETFSVPEPYGLGDFLMTEDDGQERAAQAIADADIDDLPVRLVFEVGRSEISLADLRELTVGAPVPLDRVPSSAVQIFANGRRIGSGEMVMIGQQLGVRITQMNGNA